MTGAVALSAFPDSDALARALAAHVAEALRARCARDGLASLAVSGGRTPTRFFEMLSGAPLPWDRITVTLVDERWVPETSPRSNGALVRRHLMQGPAAAAHFVPLHTGADTPEAGLADLLQAMRRLPLPLACVVLGMGDDGHTASFFPHGAGLDDAIRPDTTALLVPVRAEAAGEPRITFTLPAILSADRVFLHIEGAGKRAVLAGALAEGPVEDMPIRAVLRALPHALDVMWCP